MRKENMKNLEIMEYWNEGVKERGMKEWEIKELETKE